MKKLKDCLNLNGEIEEITMMDLRSSPGEVLTAVELGKTYIIKRNGKRVGVLMKLPGDRLTIEVGSTGEITYKP